MWSLQYVICIAVFSEYQKPLPNQNVSFFNYYRYHCRAKVSLPLFHSTRLNAATGQGVISSSSSRYLQLSLPRLRLALWGIHCVMILPTARLTCSGRGFLRTSTICDFIILYSTLTVLFPRYQKSSKNSPKRIFYILKKINIIKISTNIIKMPL